ncbi:hypothetical protein BT96DRAFT_771259, partial [Gymnopus androsaceus JB14]
IPDVTVDSTPEQFFDRPFTAEQVDLCKLELEKHPSNSAPGIEQVYYRQIIDMDSTLIAQLVNECVAHGDLGLESCMLKFVTLLMMQRFVDWADARNIIPPSQNGFRKNYRTNNNAFILRSAIEKARAMGRTLWVASIDITNAFSSVDRSTLWRKLQDLGASGRIFD